MTLPPVIRVFFAIDLSTSTKNAVGKYISMLKKNSKTHAIRWTKPENLHVTLQFLAKVEREHLSDLIAQVRNEISGNTAKAILQFGEIHLFPNPFRPRVIVLSMEPQAQDRLATLANAVATGIKLLNYEVETRPFRAHLTLGRIKYSHGINLDFLSEAAKPDFDAMEVDEVVLFRSEPQPEGSKYTVIEKISLTPTPLPIIGRGDL